MQCFTFDFYRTKNCAITRKYLPKRGHGLNWSDIDWTYSYLFVFFFGRWYEVCHTPITGIICNFLDLSNFTNCTLEWNELLLTYRMIFTLFRLLLPRRRSMFQLSLLSLLVVVRWCHSFLKCLFWLFCLFVFIYLHCN